MIWCDYLPSKKRPNFWWQIVCVVALMERTYKQLVIGIEALHEMCVDLGGQSIAFNQPIGSTHIDMIIQFYRIYDAMIVLSRTIQVVHNYMKHKNSSFGAPSRLLLYCKPLRLLYPSAYAKKQNLNPVFMMPQFKPWICVYVFTNSEYYYIMKAKLGETVSVIRTHRKLKHGNKNIL